MNRPEQQQIFDRWLAEHAAILHHVAGGFADGADRADLVQELMLALWKAVPAFQGGSRPSTFIYRVVHNAALTWRRGSSTYRRHVGRFEAEPVPDASSAAARSARDREMLALVYAEIRQLPPADRSLLLLHLDDVSHAEIGEILGLTENNVGVRLTRLKLRLSLTLKEKTHELR